MNDHIMCDGSCRYEPASYPELAKSMRSMLETNTKGFVSSKIGKSEDYIDELLEKGDTMTHIMSGKLLHGSMVSKFIVHEKEAGGFHVRLISTSTGTEIDQLDFEGLEELGPWLYCRVGW